jgi:D-aminopeptidase
MERTRLRDLGIVIGEYPAGPYNAITDVPGVLVGHRTIIHDEPAVARTGVTVVMPRDGHIHEDFAPAAYHSFNGCGEMTGLLWVDESGLLMSPIALTNTSQVGLVRDSISRYAVDKFSGSGYWLPVVAETWDGWLNETHIPHLTGEDVYAALDSAVTGPVAEGNVGGGTGMICHDFKGGIGTSSRLVETGGERYILGVLVQTNYGERRYLRVDGVPVGREIGPEQVPLPWTAPPLSSSIIIILATDAPLTSDQCRRLARRGTVGLARVGGLGHTFSGDIFLAFSTGNHIPRGIDGPLTLRMLPPAQLDPFFEAASEAVEEAILHALVAAETMSGRAGHVAYALPLDGLQRVMARYRPMR